MKRDVIMLMHLKLIGLKVRQHSLVVFIRSHSCIEELRKAVLVPVFFHVCMFACFRMREYSLTARTEGDFT